VDIIYSIDTIKLRIKLDEETCTRIQSVNMNTYLGTDKDGVILYHFSRGVIEGSYDNTINIKIWDKQFLIFEFSLTKFFLGHNCYNRISCFLFDLINFKKFIFDSLNVDLGNIFDWELLKIDVSINYDLGSQDNVKKYINSLRTVSYPRRRVRTYENECVHIAGSTSTIKFYNKLREFKAHDYSKISMYNKDKAHDLLMNIENILRVEVSIKTKKLLDLKIKKIGDFLFNNLMNDCIMEFYKNEVTKVLKNNVSVLKVFNKSDEVERILIMCCSSKMASSVMSTWFQISIHGYNIYRDKIKNNPSALRKFQKHVKIMKELNISIHDTDVMLKPSENEDFCLYDYDLFDSSLLYRSN